MADDMTTAAILTAAGSGTRLGRPEPKALVPLAGTALVVHAARRLAASGVVARIVVTVPAGAERAFAAVLGDRVAGVPVDLVVGGASRQASVAAGLARLGPEHDVVLVHDAARALAPADLVRAVDAAVRAGHAAVVPGLPVTDTVKRVGPPDAAGAEPVRETVPRAPLRAVQTPQGFDRALLERAHAAGAHRAAAEAHAATDDAGLVEELGLPVWVVPGDERALKVTTARDLAVAGLLLQDEPTSPDPAGPDDRTPAP